MFSSVAFAQADKTLSGQLICKDASLQGITILNLVTEKEAISNFEGKFSLGVKPDDLLIIQHNNFEYVRRIIDENDIKNGSISIYLTKKIEQLDEVKIVNYININAVDLNILQKEPKKYTTAERRLRTAEKFKWYSPLLIPLGGMSVDGLLNAINGRTKILKKHVAFEKIQLRSAKLSDMFTDEYYIHTLNIPEDKIKAFQNYASEEPSLVEPLRLKNKFLVSFTLIKIAETFNNLQKISKLKV